MIAAAEKAAEPALLLASRSVIRRNIWRA